MESDHRVVTDGVGLWTVGVVAIQSQVLGNIMRTTCACCRQPSKLIIPLSGMSCLKVSDSAFYVSDISEDNNVSDQTTNHSGMHETFISVADSLRFTTVPAVL